MWPWRISLACLHWVLETRLLATQKYSELSLNGHLSKTDTSLKRTLTFDRLYLIYYYKILSKTDISLKNRHLSKGCFPVTRFLYVCLLNTHQWTSLRVLSTPYVYVGRKNAALEINPKTDISLKRTVRVSVEGVGLRESSRMYAPIALQK